MAYQGPTTKKFKHPIISDHFFKPEFQDTFCKKWHGRTPFKNSDIEIITEPFRVCKISNFLKSEDFMDELKNELIDVKVQRKSIDLYQYEQTTDLSLADSNNIKTLYRTFQTNLSAWLQKNTKIVLNQKMSMTSTCYSDTDRLLCHDDNMGDRRIAFILYLSKNWTKGNGGALDLFDTDEDGLPSNVVKSIIPEYNSLVLFEVAHNSYHQVAEVTSPEKSRWSINGWFHGPPVLPNNVQRPEPVINYVEPEDTEVDLSQWVFKTYLDPETQKQIHKTVEKKSCIFLSNFLKVSVYKTLSEEIQCNDIKWRRVGPADVRNYEVADEASLPKTLADFCRIFKSTAVFELLKSYTELDLVPVKEHMHPRVTIELQRWSSGCYTLLTDRYDDSVQDRNEDNAGPSASGAERTAGSPGKCEDEAAVGGESSSRLQNDCSEEDEASEEYLQEDTGWNTPPTSTGDDEFEEEEEEEATTRCRAYKKSPRKRRGSQQPSPPKAEGTAKRCHSDSGDDDFKAEEAATTRCRAYNKSPRKKRGSHQSSPPKAKGKAEQCHFDSCNDFDNREVSDISDYLSDASERRERENQGAEQKDEGSEQEDEGAAPEVAGPGSLDLIMQFNTSRLEKVNIDYVAPREVNAAVAHVSPKDNHLCLVYKTGDICRLHRYVNHYVQGYFYNLVCTYLE